MTWKRRSPPRGTNPERRPDDHTGDGGITHMVTAGTGNRALICPRCGVPYSWTTLEVLQRCYELAREAA